MLRIQNIKMKIKKYTLNKCQTRVNLIINNDTSLQN